MMMMVVVLVVLGIQLVLPFQGPLLAVLHCGTWLGWVPGRPGHAQRRAGWRLVTRPFLPLPPLSNSLQPKGHIDPGMRLVVQETEIFVFSPGVRLRLLLRQCYICRTWTHQLSRCSCCGNGVTFLSEISPVRYEASPSKRTGPVQVTFFAIVLSSQRPR